MSRHRASLAAILLLLAAPVFAQKFTASIRGTVTDTTKAPIPAAKVTLTNEATGLTRTVSTNSDGNYAFPDIPVGGYTVQVEFAGFKTASRSRVVINVADVRAVDFTLETGAITETVSVEASSTAVKTVGADISGLIAGDQVRELPMNGRNFLQLTLIQPGITATEGLNTVNKGLSGGSDISVSGGATTSNLWLVDGADNVDHGSNRTILVYPSVDAIEEFKVQRNNYGAEFGGAGGAQINVVTRGGTNEFHGSAYYFARRDSWNAANYFLKKAGQGAAPLKWDDFGATFGGPILKDKLHFFASYEKNKDDRTEVRSSFVPTEAERNGDFSGPGIAGCSPPKPVDPLTGRPFPGDVIPANRVSQAGKLMMQLMSLPNVSTPVGCNNWVQAVPTPVNWDQINARVDWTLSNSTRVMVRYTQDSWTATDANEGLWGDDPFPVVGSSWDQPGKSLVAQLNQNIGSSMTNTLTFSYSANVIDVTRSGENPDLVKQITALIPTLYPADQKSRGGEAQPMANWGSLGPYGGGILWNQGPWRNNQDLFVVKDDYSAVFGKHFVKAGVLFSYNRKNEEPANTSQESVMLGGVTGYLGPTGYLAGENTGNAIGDWLLSGTVRDTSEIQANLANEQRWNDIEFYLADSWKAAPKWSIDFGVRASRLTPTWEANDRVGNFVLASVDPALGNSPCNGMQYVPGTSWCRDAGLQGGTDGPNRYLVPTKLLWLAPRLGVAWDVFGNGKTAIRGGLGLFYQRERVSPGLGIGQNPPITGTGSVTRTLESSAPVIGQAGASYGAPGNALLQEAANQHNWQWNIGVQHEVVRNTVVEIAYVGNKGLDLVGQTNLNEVPPANRLAYARTGDAALRPLNGIAGIGNGNLALWTHGRNSIYHGLQTAVTSRFGNDSVLSLAYTWSKVIANTGIANADGPGLSQANAWTDSTQPQLDRARGGADRTHMFNASLVLGLPKLEDRSSFVKNVLGDWQVAAIVQAGTGYPITIESSVPGVQGGFGVTGVNPRPNIVVGTACTVDNSPNKLQWLDPAHFTIDGHLLGTNGTAGRSICDGPGIFETTASIYKNIRLGPRVRMQLRLEVFNVFNNVSFRSDSLNEGIEWENVVFDAPNASTATRVISATPQGNFGQFNSARDPRLVQLGVRLMF